MNSDSDAQTNTHTLYSCFPPSHYNFFLCLLRVPSGEGLQEAMEWIVEQINTGKDEAKA